MAEKTICSICNRKMGGIFGLSAVGSNYASEAAQVALDLHGVCTECGQKIVNEIFQKRYNELSSVTERLSKLESIVFEEVVVQTTPHFENQQKKSQA